MMQSLIIHVIFSKVGEFAHQRVQKVANMPPKICIEDGVMREELEAKLASDVM